MFLLNYFINITSVIISKLEKKHNIMFSQGDEYNGESQFSDPRNQPRLSVIWANVDLCNYSMEREENSKNKQTKNWFTVHSHSLQGESAEVI